MSTQYIPIFTFMIVLFNIGLASDARLSGMGNLEFVFQDQFNQLNLYDFAKMPAGFLHDDAFSSFSVTAAGLKQEWARDSIVYWALGQAFPENLQSYAPFEALEMVGFEDIPLFALPPCQIGYESRRLEEGYGDFGERLNPQAWGVFGSYSQLSREYLDTYTNDLIRTPELLIVYSKPLLPNLVFGAQGDGFYGKYRSADEQEKATLKPFGGGTGISYNSGPFTLGLNGEYHYPSFEFTYIQADDENTETFSGHAVSPSVAAIVDLDDITWANVFCYKWVNLSGVFRDATSEADLGDLSLKDYSGKSQILYTPNFLIFTLIGGFDTKTPIYANSGGSKLFETTYTNIAGAIGCGVDLPRARAGVEGQYKQINTNNKIQRTTTIGSELTLKTGGELNVTKNFLFRCGYNYNEIDPDKNMPDDCTTMNLVTCGLGFDFVTKMRLDFAYNYKWSAFENNPDEEVTDHILFFYLKYIL